MKKHTLQAEVRELVGRKAKKLRKTGKLTATVYGKAVKSVSLTLDAKEFLKVYREAGESGLIELTVDGEKPSAERSGRQVLIHNVQVGPMTEAPIHVEFYQVDLKEKVRTKVPLAFEGQAPAVTDKLGVLLTLLDDVEVEALPTELPEHLKVPLLSLAAVDAEVKVSDLKVPSGVVILTDAALTVARIAPLVTKEAEAEAKAEEAAAAEAEQTAEAAATESGEKKAPEPEEKAPKTEEK